LPVWQDVSEDSSTDVKVITVAMDVQGIEKPKFYLEKAHATLTTVVDQSNQLGKLYGFKAVPNVYLIGLDGKVDYIELGTFNIRESIKKSLVNDWASGKGLQNSQTEEFEQDIHEKANELFVSGQKLYNSNKTGEAINLWRKAIEIDPNNYIIRKQIWAIENPDRFYKDKVDYTWQDAQLEKGR
jgi:tetratricopeptide (TPR) repeat protein|tara:strand:- start:489 stop:1040 length:552 start_codon:yes stop_codon:yes gene_type:complete